MVRAKILVVGYEPVLLATRASILNRIGLHNATACSVQDALNHLARDYYDLVFLCHTVDVDSARELLNQVNFSYPSIKVVRLYLDPTPKGSLPVVDAEVQLDYRVTSWLRALDGLLVAAA